MPRAKFFLAVVATSCATPSIATSGPQPLPNWSTATAVPERVPQQMNILRLDGDRLLWNDQETSETHIREFLSIIDQMNPQPLMILAYSAQTPHQRIKWARSLIQEVIRCKPGECLEVTTAPA